MRAAMILALALFIGQAVAELWPLPKPVPAVVPEKTEVKPERPYEPSGTRWMS